MTSTSVEQIPLARPILGPEEEERVLAVLPEGDRAAFIRALRVLSELPADDIRG